MHICLQARAAPARPPVRRSSRAQSTAEHPVNGDPCNECAACRGILDGSVLDVTEIDAASNNGVDNIRDLRDETRYTPAQVRKSACSSSTRYTCCPSVRSMRCSKHSEEPPEHVLFILATTELHKVPATILSRCQRFDFRRIGAEDISAGCWMLRQVRALR